MAALRYTDDAIDNITQIAVYVARASSSVPTGEHFADQIFDRCGLASLPGTMGRPRPELRPNLRSISFKGYVIFFHYVGGVLEIVNVLEGHRDIEAYFDEDS